MLVVARDLNDVDDLDDDLDLDYDDVRVPGSSKGSTETIKLLFHAGKPQVRNFKLGSKSNRGNGTEVKLLHLDSTAHFVGG